ncbi:unnamed protein product [Peniophora sp. CBMAI 1063]|nr:unnamed protein product [Peniophora sp. CBMAI 1063]
MVAMNIQIVPMKMIWFDRRHFTLRALSEYCVVFVVFMALLRLSDKPVRTWMMRGGLAYRFGPRVHPRTWKRCKGGRACARLDTLYQTRFPSESAYLHRSVYCLAHE